MRIPLQVAQLCGLTDQESTRYALSTVKVTRKDGRASAVAMDGRVLGVLEWDSPGDDCDFMIPQQLLSDFDGQTKYEAEFDVTSVDGIVTVATVPKSKGNKRSVSRSDKVHEGKFPNWKETLSRLDESRGPATVVLLNPDILIAALKSATNNFPPSVRLNVSHDPLNSIVIESTSDDETVSSRIVVMPLDEGKKR